MPVTKAKKKNQDKQSLEKYNTDKYYYDSEAADRAVRFMSTMLPLGGTAGLKPFVPMQWEQDEIIKPLYGVKKRANGLRRFNNVFDYVPRKNNKTTRSVGILQLAYHLDNEPNAQVYNAANDEAQARLAFNLAKYQIENNDILSAACTLRLPSIHKHKNNGIWMPLSKESKTKDGLNIHAASCDEIHEWTHRDLYNKIKTAVVARKQPLIYHTTTAGTYNPTALWMEIYDYCKKIKNGEIIDDSWLVVMYEPTDEEIASPDFDPFDEELHKRVNPGWGVSIDIDQFRAQVRQAKNSPLFLNVFKRYHLNIITKSVDVFIPHHIWAQGDGDRKIRDLSFYAGRTCYIGVDLASYEDLVSMAAVFPNDDGSIDVKMFYWVTNDKAIDRKTKNEADYITWKDQGYITIVPGNRHDYGLIRNQIKEINDNNCQIPVIGYDDWNSSQFAQDLTADGINTNPWPPQNMKLWHKPTQNLESLSKTGLIHHYGNPVLSWNIENIALKYNGEYIKPDKAKSRDKIDGAIALIIAIGEWMNHQQGPPEDIGIYFG
jgi:phage terminase large subunit-like protein